ncbi:MAG TPA: ABC transporter substrate-binding protein [Bryobacteraceae bacterium]|nr:ABC transporter substrate-binding protein [Bryobacteraceae bacterium]
MSFSYRLLLLSSTVCFFACGTHVSSKQSPLKDVRLAVLRGSLFYLPVFVAGPSGCFDRQNLTVRIEETEGSTKAITALLAGTVDVAAAGYLQVLDLVAQGRRLRAMFLIQQFPGQVLVVSPRASKPIRSIGDLKGANVGVSSPGTDPQRILDYVLRQHGMKPGDVSVIGVGSWVTQVPALEHGKVDAMFAAGITIPFLQSRHPDLRILLDLRTPELTKAALGVEKMAETVLLTQQSWLRSNPDTARRLAGSLQCSLAWIQDHTAEEIRERLPDSARSPDAVSDLEAIATEKQMLSRDGRMTPELHEAAVRIAGVPNQADLAHAYTNDFLDQR